MNVLPLVLTTLAIVVIGGGGFAILWLKTRPKKQVWTAKCYQLSEGTKPLLRDRRGNIISDIRLNDLVPYIEDTIERVEKEHGIIVHRLIRLNKTVNAVTADAVEKWGKGKREVNVLIMNETATIMKIGYDKTTGTKIFRPMPRERVGLIKSEISIKNERLKKEKDILQAITPWIVVGLTMLSLLAIVYFQVDGSIEREKLNSEATKYAAEKQVESATLFREAMRELDNTIEKKAPLGKVPPTEEG